MTKNIYAFHHQDLDIKYVVASDVEEAMKKFLSYCESEDIYDAELRLESVEVIGHDVII